MENENNENIDSLNGAEETVIPEGESAEDKATRLEEQNKKLFERAKKAEAKLKEKPAEKVITNNTSTAQSAMDILRDDAFKLYREGYDETEIDVIMKNGGRKILEDKDSPITLGIQARKEQRGAENASSMVNSKSQLSEVERKYSSEQLSNMSAAELSKILPHAD